MTRHNDNIPDPKEIEKEISEFLSKKFKDNVKVVSPVALPNEMSLDKTDKDSDQKSNINFDLLPEDLVSYLDQFIVKQDSAKAILATKICTHFNRIKHIQDTTDRPSTMVGSIKNNVLMLGPTGVGKTYIIKLIADKIGVPFVKGDATKFSETGYVGGDVEDLIRDLVREADDDIELAQYGIVYIDEIDKIAGSRDHLGADVSRTGVQRALLKPMEDTDVDLKVPHDPISMIQEIERYRKTGKRDKRSVNTRNILFIMSGAFSELSDIIRKRLRSQEIGFGAQISTSAETADILQQVRSEDLIKYGFESEFVGRLPVRAVFEPLSESDLFQILKNPNNPIILGKKLDFSAYGIQIKFDETSLKLLAKRAYEENTGARGLVSAVERALLLFEQKLPSANVRQFPVTVEVIEESEKSFETLTRGSDAFEIEEQYQRLVDQEHDYVKAYIQKSTHHLAEKYKLTMTPARIDILANCYTKQILDIEQVIKKIRNCYDSVKKIELYFFKNHDINIVLEEDAIDYIIDKLVDEEIIIDHLYPQLCQQFEHGLKLVREKTGQHRFFITRQALVDPESHVANLLKRPRRRL